MVRSPVLDKCPRGHDIHDIAIRCPNEDCDEFILFLPDIYQDKKLRTLVQGISVVLATVLAFFVFRSTHVIWPLYLFLMIGIVHLYAAIFTRGAALKSTMWLLSGVAVIISAWALLHTVMEVTIDLGNATRPTITVLPIVVWLAITAWMFILSYKRALVAIQTASSYFLAAATFTLGYWGVWVFYLENGLITRHIYEIAMGVGLLLPLLCISFLFLLPTRHNRGMREWLMSIAALTTVVFATYLIVIEPLMTALGFVLGEFFPRILGLAPLDDITTQWLGGRQWRSVVTSALLLIAAAVVVVQSALEAWEKEAQRPGKAPPSQQTQNQFTTGSTPVAAMLTPATAVSSLAGPPRGAPAIGEVGGDRTTTESEESGLDPLHEAQAAAVDVYKETFLIARVLGRTGLAIADNLWQTVRRALNIVLPVVAFTFLSMLLVLVLGKVNEYVVHGPFLAAASLWGMTLTILVAVVVLCGVAFDFAPARPFGRTDAWRRRRIFGAPLVVIAAASLLGSLCYFLVSLASAALLPVIWSNSSVRTLAILSDPYLTNLAISVAALALLAGLYALGNVRRLRGRPDWPRRYFNISAAAVVMSLAIASLYLGIGPIRATAALTAHPYQPSAEQSLLRHPPPFLASSCRRDNILVVGQIASIRCDADKGSTTVSFHRFNSMDRLSRSYEESTRARGNYRKRGGLRQNVNGRGSLHHRESRWADRVL